VRRRVSAGWEIERVKRTLEELLGLLADAGEPASGWSPAVDLLEASDRYTVRVDLPGVSSEDVVVTLRDQELRISGKKQNGVGPQPRRRCHRMERGFGPFTVEVLLPGPVHANASSARLRDGVLEVRVPRELERRSSVFTITVEDEEP
jgi:HSP20 family protein